MDTDRLTDILKEALPAGADLERVRTLLEHALDDEQRLSDCARRLLTVLSSGGTVQDIVDEGFRILGNPIGVFDAGFKLLAANWEVEAADPGSRRLMENRYLSPEDMKAINFDHIHARAMRSETPILVKNPNYAGNRIIARLNVGIKNVGHIAVTDQFRPFEPWDYQAITILRDVLVQRLQNDEFIRNSSGFHYEYLIADLLDGKVAIDKHLKDRMAYVDLHFEDLIYITVAELARSDQYVNTTHVRDKFEQLMAGSRSLMYSGQIILITTRRENRPITPLETERFRAFCREAELYCGQSNPFTSVAELPAFYKQALRAIELGVDRDGLTPSLYVYKDHALAHFCFQFRQAEQAEVFCHPAIQLLMRYDRERGAELTQTLYHFLRCERNSFAAAQELHIHRNTLVYRVKKIEQLVSVDLDDAFDREYLLASLWLHFH